MAGGVIHAAWVQAAPFWVAAAAAIYGLSTWRKQIREERQLKHAEKALAKGREAIARMRAVRTRLSQISPEDAQDKTKMRAALLALVNTRFEAAWQSWQQFQRHYTLVNVFSLPNSSGLDVASSLSDCLFDLQNHAEVAFTDWGDNDDIEHRRQVIEERKAFYGVTTPAGGKDPIEERLKQAGEALEAELGQILRSPNSWVSLRARISGL